MGTQEWCDIELNTHFACDHGCIICYAWIMAFAFNHKHKENWGKIMTLREDWDNIKEWEIYPDDYWGMYPTVHDITPKILHYAEVEIIYALMKNLNIFTICSFCIVKI